MSLVYLVMISSFFARRGRASNSSLRFPFLSLRVPAAPRTLLLFLSLSLCLENSRRTSRRRADIRFPYSTLAARALTDLFPFQISISVFMDVFMLICCASLRSIDNCRLAIDVHNITVLAYSSVADNRSIVFSVLLSMY